MSCFVLGLISDTHGLLRAEALAALRGCQIIIHAGDVGDATILERLREIAPVFAVRGNTDREDWAKQLPLRETVDVDGTLIYLLHDLHDIDLDPKFAEIGIVVTGHTHRPHQYWKDDTLYLNPGSAGPRRFEFPITVARLDLKQRPWKAEFVHLATPAS
jgi:putative phosphoesterase